MATFSLTYAVFAGKVPTEDFTFETFEVEATDKYDAMGTVNQRLSAAYLATETGSYHMMEVSEGGVLVDETSLDVLQWTIDLVAGRV